MKNENKTVIKSVISLIENISSMYAELTNDKSLCITGPAVYKSFRLANESVIKCINSEKVLIFKCEDIEAFESVMHKLANKKSIGFKIKECSIYEMRLRALLIFDDMFETVVVSAVSDSKFNSYSKLEMKQGFAGIDKLRYSEPSWAVEDFVRTYEELALHGDARHTSYTAQVVIREMLQTEFNLKTNEFWLGEIIENNTYNINKIIKYTNEICNWLANSVENK